MLPAEGGGPLVASHSTRWGSGTRLQQLLHLVLSWRASLGSFWHVFDFQENEWRIIRIMGIIPCKFPFGMNLRESSGFFLDLFVSNLLAFLPVWTCDSHAHGWLKRITNVARISARVEAVKGTSGCFLKWWYPQNTPK